LSSIPSSALILKGELRLFSQKSKFFKPDNSVRAFANLGLWSESTTWNSRPSRASSFEDSIAVTKTRRYYTWDITNLVQDWVDGTETNYGVRVLGFGGGSLFFKSREAPSKRPILHIEYTPVSYIAFGDSITKGTGDDITNDNCSNDGRNCGGGYEPILNNRLTNTFGYAHTVINQGVGGHKSSNGLSRLPDVLSAYPRSQYFLILFGTNDSTGSLPVPSGLGLMPGDPGYDGSFKDNMQSIITAIMEAGKIPYLAKVPITFGSCSTCEPFPDPDTAPRNVIIREYNEVIDELRAANGIDAAAPDFYNYFRQHPEELAENVHPNGLGYKSMARMWRNAIISAQ
jgi:lysophospholipase L1-like esterase